MRVLVVGDSVLDVDVHGTAERLCPDGPAPVVDEHHRDERPGGAGLAAWMLAADGHDVTLLTALGADADAATVGRLLGDRGVRVVDLGGAPTVVKRRLRAGGTTVARWDTRGAASRPRAEDGVPFLVRGAEAVLVADYGLGVADRADLRAMLDRVAVPAVWDPHPRGAGVPAGWWVVPNEREAGLAEGASVTDAAAAARDLCAGWSAAGVVVTRGGAGAVAAGPGGVPLVVPSEASVGPGRGDTCGAGDRFATSLAVALAAGEPVPAAVRAAVVAAGRYVAEGGVSSLVAARDSARTAPSVPTGDGDDAHTDDAHTDGPALVDDTGDDDGRVVPQVRRAPGTRVVAAGGCFDLLHAGHVRLLESARRLGDVLVVCLNSDASVRRLKGPDRPLVPEEDRRRVLEGLAAVDHVVVFDDPTPERVLEMLRPDVFVKGGDYFGQDLPEAGLLARWGGEVVTVPLLPGRSTTRLVTSARSEARSAADSA